MIPRSMKSVVSALGSVVLLAACNSPCRGVSFRSLTVVCGVDADYEGELHFDGGGAFTTFLRNDCLLSDDAVATVVEQVDFTQEVVLVSRGLRNGPSGCVDRTVGNIEACNDGVRLAYDDTVQAGTCEGYWTVVVAMPRDDVRGVIE
jgi:hypothetical protein